MARAPRLLWFLALVALSESGALAMSAGGSKSLRSSGAARRATARQATRRKSRSTGVDPQKRAVAADPEIALIDPLGGVPAAGPTLSIYGKNFGAGSTVSVGGVAATGIQVIDDGQIHVTVPALTPGTVNDVVVTGPGGGDSTLADAWFARFLDVSPAYLFARAIEKLRRRRITLGCGGGNYCPDQVVTRAQMAIFILRSKYGADYLPPDATGTVFNDVPVTAFAANWIERFAAEGITSGCGVKMYCPDNPVTRGEMAVFLLRAKYGSGYGPASPVGVFGDVAPGAPFAKWIEKLAGDGITAGCGGGNYCPTLPNTRGQMAVFLTKTFAESSQALIAEALAYDDIDYGTSLLYRAYALFWDRRLPPKYIGSGSLGEDTSLFREIAGAWDELTPDAQAALQPFILRPDDPGSVFGPASAGNRPAAAVDTKCPTQWVSGASTGGHFRIVLCSSGDLSADSDVMAAVSVLADPFWTAETKAPPAGMGLPKPDEGGYDANIDIYVLKTNQCSPRNEDECEQIVDGEALAMAVATDPYETNGAGGTISSGYILIAANRLAAPGIKSDLAHEFFHVLQFAHNVDAQSRDTGRRVHGKPVWEDNWFVEASATWAEWQYAGETSDTEVHVRFSDEYQLDDQSLLEYKKDPRHPYASYIWPFFAQQEKGRAPAPVFNSWVAAESAIVPKDITDAVDSQLKFQDHFRDFAVRNVNEKLDGNPLGETYHDQDGKFPEDKPHKLTNHGVLKVNSVPATTVKIQPLAAQFDQFFLDPAVRKVILRFDKIAKADVDVIAKIKDTWKRFKVDTSKPLVFCRKVAAEDVSQMIIVLSNHEKTEGKVLKGSYKIEREASCCGKVADAIAWDAHVTFNWAHTGSNLGYDITAQQSGNVSAHLEFVDLEDPTTRTFETTELTGEGTIHDLATSEFSSVAHDGTNPPEPGSSAGLYFDLEQCTYIFRFEPFIEATVTPPGYNSVMLVGTVVGKGLNLGSFADLLEGSGGFEARTGVWSNDHPDVSIYSPAGIGSMLFHDLSSDEIQGVAAVTWTFEPVFPAAQTVESPPPR